MEGSVGQYNCLNVSANQQTVNDRIKLIRKLRWIGMEQQAKELQSMIVCDHMQVADSVIAECRETD